MRKNGKKGNIEDQIKWVHGTGEGLANEGEYACIEERRSDLLGIGQAQDTKYRNEPVGD